VDGTRGARTGGTVGWRYITGTDIVVDGGWFSSAPYLVTEPPHHALSPMDKKERLEEFLHHFR